MQNEKDVLNKNTKKDRFEKISSNYEELFSEVFAEQGLDYSLFENSVFETVSRLSPNPNTPVLDIGTGDGATLKPFIKSGCKDLTGVDLNPEMLIAAKEKFGDKVKWVQMNATDMSVFETGQFPIIVTGAAIHNITKKERELFWKEMLRLSPEIFVSAEKIADPDPEKQKENYDREINAIKKVYGENHGLVEAEKEWLDHYEYDEREKLELNEIENAIGEQYDIEVVFEMGLYKTILATKK